MQHAEAPEKSRVRLTIGLTILIAYSGLILAITLSPTQLDVNYQNAVLRLLEVLHRNGIPSWFGYGEVEFLANVGMFVPFGFLVALLLPQRLSILTGKLLPNTAKCSRSGRMRPASKVATGFVCSTFPVSAASACRSAMTYGFRKRPDS